MNASVEVSSTEPRAVLLRRALKGNAVFSAGSGIVLAVAAPSLARIVGIPWPLALTVTGLILVAYGTVLWWQVAGEDLPMSVGWAAVVLDVLWVAGSIALLLGGWLPLSTTGKWVVALLADVVGLFAVLQFLGLRRLKAN